MLQLIWDKFSSWVYKSLTEKLSRTKIMVQLSHSYSVTTVCSGPEATAMSVCRPESFARPSGTNILASQILDQQPLNIIWTIFHGQGSRDEIQTVALPLCVHVLHKVLKTPGRNLRAMQRAAAEPSDWHWRPAWHLSLIMCKTVCSGRVSPGSSTALHLHMSHSVVLEDRAGPRLCTDLTHGSLDHSCCIVGSIVCKTARVCCSSSRTVLRWKNRVLGTVSAPSLIPPFSNPRKEMLLSPNFPCLGVLHL